ncbi:SAM-dependent methyltransferase [Crocosphaera sp.]|uniref:SAM-dependent methyltransferase n=1 Tax=Crocosphaera sp. TaxID=2729996 RepID=UPI003F2327D1|nr:SAM-dependent methyltransferase [Crocosphaera sp.]
MVLHLDKIVPIGRTLDEYVRMFSLTEYDCKKLILSVADGPASFNAEGTQLGYEIKSVDPIYVFNTQQIKTRFYDVIDNIIEQVEKTANNWVWTYHKSPQQLKSNREKAMILFCQDYEQAKKENRYEIGELPKLKYKDNEYKLGLISHFLFLYSAHLDQQFHLDSISEMLRVCQEVRIFPLITLNHEISPHLNFVIQSLEYKGYNCKLEEVSYQLQPQGNKMLKITKLNQ